MSEILTDRYNRFHNYLRISLTDNCNLRCFYCMPEENYEFTPASRLMQADEMEAIARLFVKHGVTKIRLTGGEPLVRKDAATIIRKLAALPVELTITTNGTRIPDFIGLFKEVGLKSLNISLDTLDPDRFMLITKRNQFQLVMDNIRLLQNEGFQVKINVVVMKGMNDQEIPAFIEWTRHHPVQVRFIEFMPFSGNHWTSNQVFTCQEMLERIGSQFAFEAIASNPHDTAKHFQIPGHRGSFAVISTMSNNFCGGCNRIRLTADGKLKNCLFSSSETDLLTPFRQGDDILPLIQQTIRSKHRELGGQFNSNFEKIEAGHLVNRSMITIGG
jgi:cyclic pyranopterin phosphate synthase